MQPMLSMSAVPLFTAAHDETHTHARTHACGSKEQLLYIVKQVERTETEEEMGIEDMMRRYSSSSSAARVIICISPPAANAAGALVLMPPPGYSG